MTNALITKTGYVNVLGGKIWYKTIYTKENQNKIPLVLIHGGPGFPHYYLNVFKDLAIQRPIIFYDQSGCGNSRLANPNKQLWTVHQGVNDLATLINYLQLKKVDLLGHSYGSALAVEYAARYPTKVNKLILASPFLSTKLWIDDAKKLISALPLNEQTAISRYAISHQDTKAYERAMNDYYHQHFCRLHPWPKNLNKSMKQFNTDIYHTMWGNSEFFASGNLKNFSCLTDLKKLTMPVLVTGGYYDEARPTTIKKITVLIPNAKLIIYRNSSHTAFLEQTKDYLNNVILFLQNHREIEK